MTFDYELYGSQMYDWSVIGVDKDMDGYYIGTDSGCSCYTPFQHYTKDVRTGPLTREQMEEEVMSLVETTCFITPERAKQFLEEEVVA